MRRYNLVGVLFAASLLAAVQLGSCLTLDELRAAQREAAAYRGRHAQMCGTVHGRLTLAQVYTPAADQHRVTIQQALFETAPYVRACGVPEAVRLQMREASLGTPTGRELEDAVWAASKALSKARLEHWPVEGP